MTTACGSGGAMSKTLPPTGSTSVTVTLTSTANDQLSEFDLVLQSLTLTSQSGKTVNLILTPQGFEFIHLNGQTETLGTVKIPQDSYTSATATIGAAQFTCLTLEPGGGLASDTYAYGYTPNSQVTVDLPQPITVTGDAMALSVDLLVSQSASFPNTCYSPGGSISSYSITPAFNVVSVTFSSSPTNPPNGRVAGLDGEITSIDTSGNNFIAAISEGFALPRSVSISTTGGTVYQGISGFSALAEGTFVDMDAAIQPDGSLLATRIAVEDPSAVNVIIGPLMFVDAAEPALTMWGRQQQGSDYANMHVLGGQDFSFDHAVFQISGELTNLQTLPFVPSFNGSTMVPGQNIYLSSPKLTDTSNPYTELDAITLMPQTIDGAVVSSSQSGNFTDYTVSLASYDLFPTLAVQQGQATLLTNPGIVEVYVDNNTQQLNTQPLAAGSTMRFYGLVFNDNGTLRMDCAQVNDGVPFLPPSSANSRREIGRAQTIRYEGPGRSQEALTVVTRAR